MQVGGDHYRQSDIQPWDVFLDWQLDPWLCNVIKYTYRDTTLRMVSRILRRQDTI
jgi:hypothetical protein